MRLLAGFLIVCLSPALSAQTANRLPPPLKLSLDCTISYLLDGVYTAPTSGFLLSINSSTVDMNTSRWRLTNVSQQNFEFSSDESVGFLNRLNGNLVVIKHNKTVWISGNCKKAAPKF